MGCPVGEAGPSGTFQEEEMTMEGCPKCWPAIAELNRQRQELIVLVTEERDARKATEVGREAALATIRHQEALIAALEMRLAREELRRKRLEALPAGCVIDEWPRLWPPRDTADVFGYDMLDADTQEGD
jgi:hypothetical protein